MNEVSCQTIRFLLDALEQRSVDSSPILARFALTPEKVSNPSEWVDWDFYLAVIHAVEKAYPKPGEVEAVGATLLDTPSFQVVWKLAGFFVDPYHLYWAGSRWIGNRYFRNVQYECKEQPDGRILFTISVSPRYAACPEVFFRLHEGVLAAATRVLGIEEPARIATKFSSHRGEFLIQVSAPPTFLQKLRDAFDSTRAGRVAVAELAQQQAALLQSFQDLTLAHDQLRKQEKYFRGVVENVSDVVALFNLQGEVQYISPSIELLSGYPPDQATHLFDVAQLSNADAEKIIQLNKAALRTSETHRASNLHVRHKDGSTRIIDLTVKRLHSVGEEDLLLTSVRDVTERYTAEQALRQSEEQLARARKLEAIGALAGGIAHDFNNLLQVVKNANDALHALLRQNPEALAEISDIESAVSQGIDLTRQLTAFTRRQILQTQVFDLNQVVHDMAKMLQRLVGEKIHLVVNTNSTPVCVKTNIGQIGQVVLNLVLNGRDAMPHGGSLIIEVDRVTVTPDSAPERQGVKPDDYAVLIVSDTGRGMHPKMREKILDPFAVGHSANPAMNIGLEAVRTIIHQHSGHIVIDTEENMGTTLLIYLPLAQTQPAVETNSSESAKTPPRGTETILVIDDDERIRTQICDALQHQGYQTCSAGNADDAIDIARTATSPIHLAITDLVLPDSSGLDLVKHLAGFFPDLKILFISGYTNETFVRSSWLDPTFDLLPKPFSTHELLCKTREILDESPEAAELLH